jgi:hypothetical protein
MPVNSQPMKLTRVLKAGFFNLYFLFFLNGFLLCLFVNFQLADSYEKRIFSSLANNIAVKTHNLPEDSLLSEMLHATNFLLGTRTSVFRSAPVSVSSSTEDYAASLTGDLMTAQGACGSYSKVMVKLAQELNFECRIGQMKVNGSYGGHIVPEIKTSKGWIVLDPMFDLRFINKKGESASFQEVSKNWDYYKQQVPANYNHDYRYEDVRYTNWEKIPVLMPLTKKVIDLSIGEKQANNICLRVEFLSIYNVYSFLLLLIIAPLSFYLFTQIVRNRHVTIYQGYNWQTSTMPVFAKPSAESSKPE